MELHFTATGCHLIAIWDHTVLPACHPTQANTPRLTPAIQAGTRFTDPERMVG